MTTTIQLRRDTAANWTLNNPVLALGEPGVETDTRKVKYGDGTSAWTSLVYSAGDANFSGNYDDLINKPIISDTTSLTGGDYFIAKDDTTLVLGEWAAQTLAFNEDGIVLGGTGGVRITGAAGSGITLGGGSTGTITFSSPTTGIDYNDLSNTPTGGADTGNITFSDTTLTSSNGNVKIHFTPSASPAVEFKFTDSGEFNASSVNTGTVTSADYLTLNSAGVESGYVAAVIADGDAGRVFVRTDNGTTTKTWEFDITGTLTVPAYDGSQLYIQGGEIAGAIDGSGIGLSSHNANVVINTYNPSLNSWQFDTDGNLTLPKGSIIGETENTTVITPPTALAGQSLVIRPTAGALYISTDHPDGFVPGESITVTVTCNGGSDTGTVEYTFTDASSEQLGTATTGTLSFNEESAKTLTWTVPAQSDMTTFTFTITGGTGFGQLGGVNTGAAITITLDGSAVEGGHVHLVSGDPTTVDIYLGDDDQYVKIEKNGGNVVIGTDANNNHWRFGTDGNLTLPAGGDIVNSAGQSVYVKETTVPTTSVGSEGDFAGRVAFDDNYMYRCVANYDGETDIWKRVALDSTPWPVMYTLTVTTAGDGSGIVTSAPAGIDNGTLTATFVSGTVVTLSASAAMGSAFAGWAGPEFVSGTGTATVTMTSPVSVTATFDIIPPPPPTLVSIEITPANSSAFTGNDTDVQFTATGTYSDGSTADITSTVTWASTPGYTTSGINGSGSLHLLEGETGSTTITATLDSITATTALSFA